MERFLKLRFSYYTVLYFPPIRISLPEAFIYSFNHVSNLSKAISFYSMSALDLKYFRPPSICSRPYKNKTEGIF